MKNIGILVLSSANLSEDNFILSDLIGFVNLELNKQDVQLNLSIYGDKDIDSKLDKSEVCIFLFGRELNNLLKAGFLKAHSEFIEGRNPRKNYVLFKDEKEEELTEEMRDFKSNFANNFGHFYGVYDNAESLRLQILLQIDLYLKKILGKNLLTIKDGNVQINEKDVVDIDKVAFLRDNEKLKDLKAKMVELNEKISNLRQKIALDPENENLFDEILSLVGAKRDLEKEYNVHKSFLFDIKLTFTKLATKELNETTKQAMALFEKGQAEEANNLLEREKVDQDISNMYQKRVDMQEVLAEINKECEYQINAYLAKVKTIMASTFISAEEAFNLACSSYDSAIELAEKIDYDKTSLSKIYIDYADFLSQNDKNEKALEYTKKAVALKKIFRTGIRE